MRQILTFKLTDGTKMAFVCDCNDKVSAKSMAINYNQKVFNQPKYILSNKSELADYEKWSVNKQTKAVEGNRVFNVAVIFNGQVNILDIDASGVKNAYNNIVKRYCLDKRCCMFIYDTTQIGKLRSSIELAVQKLNNPGELDKTLNDYNKHLKNKNYPAYIVDYMKLMMEMTKDYTRGTYKEVPYNTVVLIIAIIIYLLSPVNLALEWIPMIGQMDDIAMIGFVIKHVGKDIDSYRMWRQQQSEMCMMDVSKMKEEFITTDYINNDVGRIAQIKTLALDNKNKSYVENGREIFNGASNSLEDNRSYRKYKELSKNENKSTKGVNSAFALFNMYR